MQTFLNILVSYLNYAFSSSVETKETQITGLSATPNGMYFNTDGYRGQKGICVCDENKCLPCSIREKPLLSGKILYATYEEIHELREINDKFNGDHTFCALTDEIVLTTLYGKPNEMQEKISSKKNELRLKRESKEEKIKQKKMRCNAISNPFNF